MANEFKLVSGTPQSNTVGTPGVEQVVDGTFGSSRVSLRPVDYVAGGVAYGHYSLAAVSGATTTLAAGTLLFSMRWGSPVGLMMLERITVSAAITTAFTANQVLDVDAIAVRGWVTSDSAGTAITIPANSNKARTTMGSSLISVNGDIRIASATAITAGGTKTPDTNAFAAAALPGLGASGALFLGGTGPVDLYNASLMGQHPMVFAANEGFNLRFVTTQAASGVVKYYVRVDWAEVPGF